MQRFRGKLTYANVISTLALILAVGGGTAYAASSAGSSSSAALKLCAAKKSGALRLASGGGCKRGERALSINSRGTQGPAGAPGPGGSQGDRGSQGERGPAGPATSLESPDGRFAVRASNAGIVLSGPSGSLNFNGSELLASSSLVITAPSNLTILSGIGLNLTAGVNTNFTTGADFSQSVGGSYSAESGGAAVLLGSELTLGGPGSCPAAARVGSVVSAAPTKVTATGSSSTVFVC
jgi:hypothetical protein